MGRVLSEGLVEALRVFENPKFMATRSREGEPNIALVMTWTVFKDDTLVYGDFMTYKTRQNIEEDHRMSLLVMTMGLDSWHVKTDFEGFHRADEYYEFIAMTPLFRYNQYTNARAAGVAQAVWASDNFRIGKLSVLTAYLKSKRSRKRVPEISTSEGNMPRNMVERFNRMDTVKVVAFVNDDGYPHAFPALGMVAASQNTLVFNRNEEKKRGCSLSDGQRVAVSLVTMEPQVFQVKGTFRELDDTTGYVLVDRAYVCSLPRPGERVDVPMLRRVETPL
ncbi:MAG: pyridoxamine 5'-phosphate oxidase family protein [Candidatus Thorarchaeota archaeon]